MPKMYGGTKFGDVIMPKVTIIIPCYNVEAYIDRCMESVMLQTMDDYEIILIDDGSTDGTLKKCAAWKKKNDRIILVTKRNCGLGPTRNMGIAMANGEYITFLDADDWWHEDYLLEMMYGTRNGYTDLVICDFDFVYEDNYSRQHKASLIRLPEGNVDINTEVHLLSRARTQACGKLYRRSLFVDNNVLEPSHAYEDVATTPYIVAKAKTIYHVAKPLYSYVRNRPGSIINHFPSLDGLLMSLSELAKRFKDEGMFQRYYFQLRRIFWGELCFLYRTLDTKFVSNDDGKSSQLKRDCEKLVYDTFPELETLAKKKIYIGEDDFVKKAVECITFRKTLNLREHADFSNADVAVIPVGTVVPEMFNGKVIFVDYSGRDTIDTERTTWDIADDIFDKMISIYTL